MAASSGTYTKTEIDGALGAKANTADVVASLLEKHNNFGLIAPLMWNLNIENGTVDLMVDSYSKEEVDNAIASQQQQISLTTYTPTNGVALLNGSTVRGLGGSSPIAVSNSGDECIVGLILIIFIKAN